MILRGAVKTTRDNPESRCETQPLARLRTPTRGYDRLIRAGYCTCRPCFRWRFRWSR